MFDVESWFVLVGIFDDLTVDVENWRVLVGIFDDWTLVDENWRVLVGIYDDWILVDVDTWRVDRVGTFDGNLLGVDSSCSCSELYWRKPCDCLSLLPQYSHQLVL